ncbi:outer membrane protein assembly factor BamD [Mucilaginibacter terrenus]|uniref:Outer membrane protein assembly factor BamD n=1 Tax=Mucilaginibacter terrenus TaxID=2482727 RepID=A0A3E2NJE8_9SPHI|nr:tetratricopeptide repeat protein [Mucilaginibacter terrenus]RFZ81050.1 outer membrane protein assembly factor BamD [Mucilaginibacter terrenus]
MKRFLAILIFTLVSATRLFAQDNDLLLARQYAQNGEQQKALDIYLKLYKQDNELYFQQYLSALLNNKKFDEAESITKKMIKRHAGSNEYVIALGSVYTQQGQADKADAVYSDLIKNLPADQNEISSIAAQFYQNANVDYAIRIFLQGRKVLRNDALFSFELINLYRYKRDKPALTEEYLNFLPSNPSFINQAQSVLATVYEGSQDYEALKFSLFKRIQKDPQQVVYINLLTWQFLQQKEYDQALNQALALSRRTNDDGSSVFELCSTLVANNAFDAAIRGYEYVISKGKENPNYVSAKIEILNTRNLKVTSGKYTQADLLSLEQDYLTLLEEFGRNRGTLFAMEKLATLQAFKLHKLKEAQSLLQAAVNIQGARPNLIATCKLDLGDVYLLNNRPWDATLEYSQVEKDNSAISTAIGQEALFRNAKLAYYMGDFTWSRGQLDVLKAATTQLIANDALNLSLLISDNLAADSTGAALKMYARADLLIFSEQTEKAIKTLDSIGKKYPENGLAADILMAKTKIAMQQQDYANAITLLKQIADKYPDNLWADDAVYMLGDIYENSLSNPDLAKTYYQKIIADYPGSLWLNEARKRFRLLRGDKNSS